MSTDAGVLGTADAPNGRRANHICWVYADPGEFRARAAAFLRQGLAAGQRVEFFGSGDVDALRGEFADTAEFGDLFAGGNVAVRSLHDWYGSAPAADPSAQVAAYAGATEAALAEGYSGLRVAVEATPLVRTGTQRDIFCQYEHLIDRYMVDRPFSAMCGYDGAELGGSAQELACLHPRVSPGATPLQWWAVSDADMGLAGKIDVTSVDVLDVTLERTLGVLARPRLQVDAHGVEFIDHRGLLTLERRARRRDLEITLRTDAPVVHRLADLLGLQAVRPEWTP